MNQPLAGMLRYNRWANETLFTACHALPDASLDLALAGASGPVRELLVHVVGGQQTFVLRTRGRQHEGELSRASTWPGWETLLALAAQSADELIAIAESLDADVDVDLPFMGKTFRFPRSFFLVHAVEHGVEHRTEIKLILGHHGIATPDLDGWAWAQAAGYGAEV